MKSKNCQTARGNVRRGLWGDGRRNGTWEEEKENKIRNKE